MPRHIHVSYKQPQTNAQRLYIKTSNQMALQIWQGHTTKHPARINNRDLAERLRLAHTLLLQLQDVYFSQHRKTASLQSQQWLALRCLNDRDSHHWHIVG